MAKYYVDYMDDTDDLCHVWVNANSKQDAIDEVNHEYWDVKQIISVQRA